MLYNPLIQSRCPCPSIRQNRGPLFPHCLQPDPWGQLPFPSLLLISENYLIPEFNISREYWTPSPRASSGTSVISPNPLVSLIHCFLFSAFHPLVYKFAQLFLYCHTHTLACTYARAHPPHHHHSQCFNHCSLSLMLQIALYSNYLFTWQFSTGPAVFNHCCVTDPLGNLIKAMDLFPEDMPSHLWAQHTLTTCTCNSRSFADPHRGYYYHSSILLVLLMFQECWRTTLPCWLEISHCFGQWNTRGSDVC